MVKKIYIDGECYGEIGKLVPSKHHKFNYPIFVGDILTFYHDGEIESGVVLNESNANTYGIYGYWCKKFDFDKAVKLLNYSETDDHSKIRYVYGGKEVTIEDDREVEMTIEQIQRILGHKVKIIKS